MVEILHRITINAEPAVIYRLLETQEGLSSWWTSDANAAPVRGSGDARRLRLLEHELAELLRELVHGARCVLVREYDDGGAVSG